MSSLHFTGQAYSHSFYWLCLQKLAFMSNSRPFRSICLSSTAPAVWFLPHPPLPCTAELTTSLILLKLFPRKVGLDTTPIPLCLGKQKSPNCLFAPVLQGNTQGNHLLSYELCLELLLKISSSPLFLDMFCSFQRHEDLGTDLAESKFEFTDSIHGGN